jgi:glucose-1-phosphate thymidylyltransferase
MLYQWTRITFMKGIVLAGGPGSRLHTITLTVSKQLLPVYNKPLIYYPITTLMLAGIREILIITTPEDQDLFKKLLGNGSQWGVSFSYAVQPKPGGIAQGILLGEDFLGGEGCALILGDNIFFGSGLGRQLQKHLGLYGAHLYGYEVENPESYGVIEFNESRSKILGIEEKPSNPKSNFIVTGLYFYDSEVVSLAKSLVPSSRNELEITDLNNAYIREKQVSFSILEEESAWFDVGSFEGLFSATDFVRTKSMDEGFSFGNPSEVGKLYKWI